MLGLTSCWITIGTQPGKYTEVCINILESWLWKIISWGKTCELNSIPRGSHLGLPHLQGLLGNQLLRAWERHCSTARIPIRWSCWPRDRGNQSHPQWLLPFLITAIQGLQGSLEMGKYSAQPEHAAFLLDATSSLAVLLPNTWWENKSSWWSHLAWNGQWKVNWWGRNHVPHCWQLSSLAHLCGSSHTTTWHLSAWQMGCSGMLLPLLAFPMGLEWV